MIIKTSKTKNLNKSVIRDNSMIRKILLVVLIAAILLSSAVAVAIAEKLEPRLQSQ